MADVNELDESSDVPSENDYEDADNSKDEHDDDMMAEPLIKEEHGNGEGTGLAKKPKLDPKDPLRPRRKKARRACFACQRAHLTCGDERPCQRCIKRGLGDQCQDGVRKKAKYLHDAPPEALRPVLGPNYNPTRNGGTSGPPAGSPTTSNSSSAIGGFYSQANTSPTYSLHYPPVQHTQMRPPLTEQLSFTQQSPISPPFQTPGLQRPVSMQGLTGSVSASNDLQSQNAFAMLDPSNPAMFNFVDPDGMGFVNRYGALELQMLNHMASGAAETPPRETPGSIPQHADAAFNTAGIFNNNLQYGQMYPQQDSMLTDYSALENHSGDVFDVQRNYMVPRAYAIETSSTSFASPSTDNQLSPQPSHMGFESSPTTASYNANSTTSGSVPNQPGHHRNPKHHESKSVQQFGKPTLVHNPKRSRDPSSIYTTVTEPYSYTTGFHALIAFVKRRFNSKATIKIAKSLASVRPSFISCTKTLNREDLIFMEKCFQRTLFEYEESMQNWGTPTVVCRRTGEIAAINKEFTLLTGWTQGVVFGTEPNLNVNTGKSATQSSENGKVGLTTPLLRYSDIAKPKENRPQPVFIAELLDEDTAVEFYEDFSKLAFGDSRGSVKKRCHLLKYQTKEDVESEARNAGSVVGLKKDADGNLTGTMLGGRVSKIDGEYGIGRLQKDGKLDCAYCWMVKRDVFDIPMLIVMNFLPCIH